MTRPGSTPFQQAQSSGRKPSRRPAAAPDLTPRFPSMGTMTCSAAPAIRLSALDARTFAVRQSRRGLPGDVLDGDVTPAVAWLIAMGIVLAAAGLIAAGLGAHSFIAADVPTASQTAAPATRHDRLVAAPAPHDRGAKPATPSRRDVPPVTRG